MKGVSRALQGRLRRAAVLGTAAAAWALGAGAAGAQLPEAPKVTPPAPVAETVDKALQQPLPKPAEEVVSGSPAAGVRDTVRDAGGSVSAGGSGGGSGTSSGATAQAAPPAGDRSGASAENSTSSAPAAREGRGAGAGSGRGAAERGSRTAAARDGSRPRAERAATARATPASGERDEGGLRRTVRDIVEVVPTWIWAALGVLAALALALAARTGIERRDRRRLEREREELLGDIGLLQSALLPEVPERLGKLEASVAYRPADGPAAGGDFYDVFELPDGRVAALLGDVSGHGRDALVRTASVRHSLRTLLRSGLGPRDALEAAGRQASDEADGGFVTVVAAVHDPAAGTLTYSAAGHPPPIVLGPADHEPITVASSPPLGLGLPTGLRQTTIDLPRGSVACLFSDGLLEARIGGDLVGRERLAAMVAALSPDEGAERLLARMLETADATPDDMAACVLRAIDGPATAGLRVEELEIGAAPIELEAAGDLLRACGVRQQAVAEAIDEAAAAVSSAGGAILVTTIGHGEPHVDVLEPMDESPVAGVR